MEGFVTLHPYKKGLNDKVRYTRKQNEIRNALVWVFRHERAINGSSHKNTPNIALTFMQTGANNYCTN